jgi:nitrous oxidase accessory protein NosD
MSKLRVGANREFQTIQSAVDAARDGDVIKIDAGTYVEQVTIKDKVLTIQGTGDATRIVAPEALVANVVDTGSGTPSKNAVIGVEGGNVTISHVLVDGAGHGDDVSASNGAADFNGIVFLNAQGSIDHVTVTGIRDPLNEDGSLSGAQRGNGIFIANRDGVERTVHVENSTVMDFQKTGIVFSGDKLIADIDHNTVTGDGLQPLGSPAQNGIQVSSGATGTIERNTISGIGYGPDQTSATGILVYGSDDVAVSRNTITMVGNSQDAGIAFIDSNAPTATGNTVTASYGIYQQGDFTQPLVLTNNHLEGSAVAVGFYPTPSGPSHVFTGSKANDDIWGSDGADRLDGGKGDDFLVGGGGNDTFVFQRGSGRDEIADFAKVGGNRDLIDVGDYSFKNFAKLQARISDDSLGNAVVRLNDNNSVTVIGVNAAELSASDFIL